jgi:hypothetical protein
MDKKTEEEIIFAARAKSVDSPVDPVRLKAEDRFCFSCHGGVSCWNKCCHGTDVVLTPMDILVLSRHLGLRPQEFLLEHAITANWEKADLPVAKLKMTGVDGQGACPFVTDAGCSVYEDRPATCRYYPLGLATVKMKGAKDKEDFHFLVKESHCKGHEEDKQLSVKEFRAEQEVDYFDRVNRGWMDVLMKMASWKTLGGPFGKDMTPQTKFMFLMVSTDVDALRRFVLDTKFLEIYEVDPETIEVIKTDDEALLQVGFEWFKNVTFNESTIKMKEKVLQKAIAKAREDIGAA